MRIFLRSLKDQPAGPWMIAVILMLFAVLSFAEYRDYDGDDLGSSYVGCRLVAAGQVSHLYAHDPKDFAAIGPDKPWQDAADSGEFTAFLHPYVQTPLWAWVLQPLCTGTEFQTFQEIFTVLTMLSFVGCLWLTARFWAPSMFNSYAMALVVTCLWFSEPFGYAMALMQTHMLLLVMTIAALILAERERPVAAGLLLACATAVKVTPGMLLIYWLLTRRFRAAASMVAWSAVLVVITLLTTGPQVFATYLACLHRVSRVLLLSMNNQSFVAWFMEGGYNVREIYGFRILGLPDSVRIGSTALMVGFTVLGGVIDRRNAARGLSAAPLGAMIALMAATIFAPIAWTHYFVLLMVPLMVIVEENQRLTAAWSRWCVAGFALLIVALNFQPLATDIQNSMVGSFSLIRSEFYAGGLCIALLGVLAWCRRAREQVRSVADEEAKDEAAERPMQAA
ncbi:glycosyltransferase family 87 protein [Granulicella tundricola]|uniref:DUF2029 domain-containing protein n=1 Tax=Granulicella tundricola (strain ATCC BAA-1859 / DSM 23138 / MP5ACTX9) TaxID=1198114 RepID=E8WXR7_GRATM|nr:glycosyltransferase family 87 protein [Granulicella tundricola]ADW69762.1 hypothetical protein AciX9_2738 [Granulicella tundricola MP5ACTX9]